MQGAKKPRDPLRLRQVVSGPERLAGEDPLKQKRPARRVRA